MYIYIYMCICTHATTYTNICYPPVGHTLTKILESESNIIGKREAENCLFGIWFKYVKTSHEHQKSS